MAECVPCAAGGDIPTAGIPSHGAGDASCKCHSCCCKKEKLIKKCYRQPKVPESFAPVREYYKPCKPLETCTTYKLSYLPVEGCKGLRAPAVKPVPNIVPSVVPMEGETIQKLSYLPNPVCVRGPIRPCNHDLTPHGPVQSITTQRHDYVPKPCVVRKSMKPPTPVYSQEVPMEDKTINRLSYLPPECSGAQRSYAPVRCYERPCAPMESCTTQRLSYLPNQVGPRESNPWAEKGQYQRPCQPLEGCTTYKLSYLDNQSDCRRAPILPTSGQNPVTASKRFETCTIYRNSYLPAKAPKPFPVLPEPNITLSTVPMEGETVNKLSYLPNPVCVRAPIRPCNHDLRGNGPIQSITTQRHDYVPKPVCPSTPFRCIDNIKPSMIAMEDKTINRLSYINPGCAPPQKSYAPVRCYEKPCAPMEGLTVQKMSYRPVCTTMPERPPWAEKSQYQRPCGPVECTTIYQASFLPPGDDCSEEVDPCQYGDCKKCVCAPPGQCIPKDPCACDFPKAEVCCT